MDSGDRELAPDRHGATAADEAVEVVSVLAALAEEVARLRRVVLKQGHSQELFQQRIDDEVRELSRQRADGVAAEQAATTKASEAAPAAAAASGQVTPSAGGDGASGAGGAPGGAARFPSAAQQRALLDLDRAVLHLLQLARGGAREAAPNDQEGYPRSVAEGLGLLQIRVRNLQLSMGLEAVPTVGHPFDDRLHQVHALSHRADVPDDQVTEEARWLAAAARDEPLAPRLVRLWSLELWAWEQAGAKLSGGEEQGSEAAGIAQPMRNAALSLARMAAECERRLPAGDQREVAKRLSEELMYLSGGVDFDRSLLTAAETLLGYLPDDPGLLTVALAAAVCSEAAAARDRIVARIAARGAAGTSRRSSSWRAPSPPSRRRRRCASSPGSGLSSRGRRGKGRAGTRRWSLPA